MFFSNTFGLLHALLEYRIRRALMHAAANATTMQATTNGVHTARELKTVWLLAQVTIVTSHRFCPILAVEPVAAVAVFDSVTASIR